MERTKSLNRKVAIIIIAVFHLIGFIGLNLASFRPYFLPLVPWHLLLMLAVLCFCHRGVNVKFFLFMLLIFAAGYGAEYTGIHTGLLFGSYTYGNTLGPKLYGVPVIIGVNWFLLIYSAGIFMQRMAFKKRWMRVLLGAVMLTVLDVLIEPTAIRLNYWRWTDSVVPITNYLSWFVLSAVLLFFYEKIRFRRQSIVGEVLLITQFVFFVLLLL